MEGDSIEFSENMMRIESLNQMKFNIFQTVNQFPKGVITKTGKYRRIVNVQDVLSWAIEIDNMPIDEQEKRIKQFSIEPSMIIRSKRGYHIYWNAKPGATVGNYSRIATALNDYFEGDTSQLHAAAFLRAPNFTHWKDLNDPFFCSIEYESDFTYSEEFMLDYLKPIEKKLYEEDHSQPKQDQMKILKALSGTKYVDNEEYSFKRQSNGNYNIFVNSEPCGAFIDKQGQIGSAQGGGPTALQWLGYFNIPRDEAKKIIGSLNFDKEK